MPHAAARTAGGRRARDQHACLNDPLDAPLQAHAVPQRCHARGAAAAAPPPQRAPDEIHMATVLCGTRAPHVLQLVTLVKSWLAFAPAGVRVVAHLVVDDALVGRTSATSDLDRLNSACGFRLHLRYYRPNMPAALARLFKPCATARLFMLGHIQADSLIYMDVDAVVAASLRDLQREFLRFGAHSVVGMVEEQTSQANQTRNSWYTLRHTNAHQFVQPYGVNSGVLLVNLTRWRQENLLQAIMHRAYCPFVLRPAAHLPLGDQDMLNIFFAAHPHLLTILPCDMNMRACTGFVCTGANSSTMPRVMHGNNNMYFKNASCISAFQPFLDLDLAADQSYTTLPPNIMHNVSFLHVRACSARLTKGSATANVTARQASTACLQLLDRITHEANAFVGQDKEQYWLHMGHIAESPSQVDTYWELVHSADIQTVCEVGFNAGHSTAVFLESNPHVVVWSFDLMELAYSTAMVAWFHRTYRSRFHMIRGLSQDTLPMYASKLKCDVFSIDGDHSYQGALTDLTNALKMMDPGGTLIADDASEVRAACMQCMSHGTCCTGGSADSAC